MSFFTIRNHVGRYVVYGTFAVLVGVLIENIRNRTKDEAPVPAITALEPKPIESLQAVPTKAVASMPQSPDTSKEKPEPYQERLKQFDKVRSHVLLKDAEAMEKERLLANVKTIHWIESQLSASPANGKKALGERLSMIDFLEESLAWKDNPARNDVLDSLNRALKTNNLARGSKETKQMLAGDKIELFAILANEEPNRAKDLLENTDDKQLLNIFQYAVKRLALKKLSGEDR